MYRCTQFLCAYKSNDGVQLEHTDRKRVLRRPPAYTAPVSSPPSGSRCLVRFRVRKSRHREVSKAQLEAQRRLFRRCSIRK